MPKNGGQIESFGPRFCVSMMDIRERGFESNNRVTLWGITWMSFFWSVSSLMVFSILPAFLVDELQISHAHIGIIDGIAISASFAAKFFSGVLSDILKKRKPLIMIGTIMTLIIKPAFALCSGAFSLFGVRFLDRLSKGIRSAPTDALIADLSESNLYATNFGIRQSWYIAGEVVGALVAMLVMLLSNNNYRLVFLLAFIPAFVAAIVLWLGVRPNPHTHPAAKIKTDYQKIQLNELKSFPKTFWWLMLAFFFLMLARFSEAFLTLKAKESGWIVAYLPIMLIVMNIVHACVSIPTGRYADKYSRKTMLAFGLFMMFAAQMTLSMVTTVFGVILGIILVGVHMGITQGLLKAMIAQSTPPALRGTAFSMFFVVSGVAIFFANVIAGRLSDLFGLYATFLAGAFFTIFSAGIIYFAFFSQKARAALNLQHQ